MSVMRKTVKEVKASTSSLVPVVLAKVYRNMSVSFGCGSPRVCDAHSWRVFMFGGRLAFLSAASYEYSHNMWASFASDTRSRSGVVLGGFPQVFSVAGNI